MGKYKIVLGCTTSELTRPDLDRIMGAQRRTNSDADEVIVICSRPTKPAEDAVDEYGDIKVTIASTEPVVRKSKKT